jgi:hypothetical protein
MTFFLHDHHGCAVFWSLYFTLINKKNDVHPATSSAFVRQGVKICRAKGTRPKETKEKRVNWTVDSKLKLGLPQLLEVIFLPFFV